MLRKFLPLFIFIYCSIINILSAVSPVKGLIIIITKNDDGTWRYRIVRMINGRRVDVGGMVDILGNPFKTRKAAISAREARIQESA